MPNTRPGISLNKEGVCSACQAYENRRSVDYKARWEELKVLCNKYRKKGEYDCVIAVSGGKDSHFQVYIMKEMMKMNPLLVTVEDNFPMTEAGKHNIRNISKEFSCNIISFKPDIFAQKQLGREHFEKYGKPTYLIDRYIYTIPLHIASKFNIPLVVYGENIDYEYGGKQGETYSAKEQVNNAVASGIDVGNIPLTDPPDLNKLEPIYLSYFVGWNSFGNYRFAKSRGFHDLSHEWRRTHHIEDFDQIDSRAYLIHPWLKYPKYGHTSATDYASRFVRYGMLARVDAVELAKRDKDLDPLCVRDFCEFYGYTEDEFWTIVDKFYNPELFEKVNGTWKLK